MALAIGLVIVVLGTIGWFAFGNSVPGEEVKNESEKKPGIELTEGEAEITQIPIDASGSSLVRPELDRTVTIPVRFNAEAKAILLSNIKTLKSQIENDPGSFQAWSDLAMQYKIIDDFEGAAEIWEFLNKAAENNTVSRVNLGNLYHYELKEYAKAEASFKAALAINNRLPEAYTGLHELYRYSYKTNTTLAEDILKDGIAAISQNQNIDLKLMLAGYYKEKGRNADAKEFYTQARAQAETLGNTQLVSAIDAELATL